MLTTFIVFVLVAALSLALAQMFNGGSLLLAEDASGEKRFVGLDKINGADTSRAAVLSVLTSTAAYFGIKHAEMTWTMLLFFVIMTLIFIYLLSWWRGNGSEFKELFLFTALVGLVIFPITMLVAKLTAQLVTNAGWASVITVIPKIMLVITLGVAVYDLFAFRERTVNVIRPFDNGQEVKIKENARRQDRNLARVALLLTVILLLLILFSEIAWGGFGFKEAKADAAMQTNNSQVQWYHFYNGELQLDEDESNNYNFGPNPIQSGLSATDYDRIFRERLKVDPALAAADMAWADAVVGTRYLGEFYETCQHDWATTINWTKERFIADQVLYYQSLDAFFTFLDAADVTVRECRGVSDQMYMDPYTSDGVPDVIVLLTDDHTGYELVYKFRIKENTFEVAYRINCGFQPTDVAEIMDIVPQGTMPTPTPEPTPTPTPTPEPPYNKDPNKAPKENTELNDVPGSGPDTNNGVGATESTMDQSNNTNHYSSYDAYREDINKLNQINQSQQTGSTPSTPTTPKPSANTKVDNNGDTGTSTAAPINNPTPVSGPVHEAETGETIDNTPGEAWGGPPD